MRAGAGKQKGSAFERKLCVLFSLWVTDGKRKDVFWRSAMSGGRATVSRGDVRQAGDMCAVASEGHALTDHWFFEFKHVRDLAIDSCILKGRGLLAKFWRVALREAQKHGRDPMLVARQNNVPTIVLSKVNHLAHWTQPRLSFMFDGCMYDVTLFDQLMKSRFASVIRTGRKVRK